MSGKRVENKTNKEYKRFIGEKKKTLTDKYLAFLCCCYSRRTYACDGTLSVD